MEETKEKLEVRNLENEYYLLYELFLFQIYLDIYQMSPILCIFWKKIHKIYHNYHFNVLCLQLRSWN